MQAAPPPVGPGRIRPSESADTAQVRGCCSAASRRTASCSGLRCEHATSRLTRTEADGRISVLAERHGERALNSPNDMEARNRTRLPRRVARGRRRLEQAHAGADDFGQPNGLRLSPDERHLFVNDTERGHIRRFVVRADGTLIASTVWATLSGEGGGAPDGMKIDSAGTLFCCGPGGIHVFAPEATCLGVIRTPEVAANFTWGDEDLKRWPTIHWTMDHPTPTTQHQSLRSRSHACRERFEQPMRLLPS